MDLDLEINNYSVNDLEKFFRFRSSQNYSIEDVETNEYLIREQLLSSGHIDKRFKRDLIIFLTEAKNRLIAFKFPTKKENLPTTIAKNAIIDTSNIPRSREEPTSRVGLVIERPETQYIHTNPSEYFPGIINPLNKRVITKFITVDTRFRNNFEITQSSDFLFTLPTKINKVVSMQITALEIPKSFYSISSSYGNNSFVMEIWNDLHNDPTYGIRTIVIPDGNYTAQGLIDKINDILCPCDMNKNMINKEDIFSYVLFTLNKDDDGSGNGKVVVQPNPYCNSPYVASIEEIRMTFNKDSAGNNVTRYLTTKIGWNLGFMNCSYKGQVIYYSEKQIEPNSIKYFYLAVDDFNKSVNETFVTAFEKNGLSPNILARVSMKGNQYDNIINKDHVVIAEPRKYFGPVDIQRLHIRLFDDHGRILNMNYSDYSFCLKLEILYDI